MHSVPLRASPSALPVPCQELHGRGTIPLKISGRARRGTAGHGRGTGFMRPSVPCRALPCLSVPVAPLQAFSASPCPSRKILVPFPCPSVPLECPASALQCPARF